VTAPIRTRRPPPPWRPVEVVASERVSPRLARVTLGGDLGGMVAEHPAASIRLLIPAPGGELVIPAWSGNEFLLPDGTRPVIRTLTPLRGTATSVDVEVVLHGASPAAAWAADASGAAALSGPGRGYEIDPGTTLFRVFGDESALPAVTDLLAHIAAPVDVHIEIASPEARRELPAPVAWHDLPPGATPGDTLVAAVADASYEPGTRVWAAGEAAAMQRIRRLLFEERGVPRSEAWIRGYWKAGRSGAEDLG
jgi:NADPH-dependent ferric siderophore reductase